MGRLISVLLLFAPIAAYAEGDTASAVSQEETLVTSQENEDSSYSYDAEGQPIVRNDAPTNEADVHAHAVAMLDMD